MSLSLHGWLALPSGLDESRIGELRDSLFGTQRVGARCLLHHPLVADTAVRLRRQLTLAKLLRSPAAAIQAIAFDKTATTNWKVAWHQDLMFPLAHKASAPGYDLACEKDRVPYARPPRETLESLTAVRLSLDDCAAENGPLRVAPGTHLGGILSTAEIPGLVARSGEVACTNRSGDLLLMKPLLLHASSQASSPQHRRVLHFVFHDGVPPAEPWYQSV